MSTSSPITMAAGVMAVSLWEQFEWLLYHYYIVAIYIYHKSSCFNMQDIYCMAGIFQGGVCG